MSQAQICFIGLGVIVAIIIIKEIATRMGDKKYNKKKKNKR